MITRCEMYAALLRNEAFQEDPHPATRKYRVFRKEGKSTYFLGPNGAVRKGRCCTRSYNITERIDWNKIKELYDRLPAGV
jgi:hypothetical protein